MGDRAKGRVERLAAEWLQRQVLMVSVAVASHAVQTAARDRSFHPVKTYLQGLPQQEHPSAEILCQNQVGVWTPVDLSK